MNTITVYCGSNTGLDERFAAGAEALGTMIAGRGQMLVYGGTRVGLMGRVADAALAAGGLVVGVIPRHILDRGIAHDGLTELHVVETMHERKAMMARLGDGFVALPGGMGTLEELAEVITWTQLGLHHKPLGLLDIAGYYRHLLAFFDESVRSGFVRAEHRDGILAADDPATLLEALGKWEAVHVDKWVN